MGDITTCGECHARQSECAKCPFNCDLHPFCQDQGCEADKGDCQRVRDREQDIANLRFKDAAEWNAAHSNEPPRAAVLAWDALCELERRLTPQTPPVELSHTRLTCPGCGYHIDECDCRSDDGRYGVKYILETNPTGGDSWVARMFLKEPQEKPMSAAEFAFRWLVQIITPIYLYVVGMVAAFFFAASSVVHGYSPLVCQADAYGYILCTPMIVNPSAKIIHVDPFEREPAPVAQPLPPIPPLAPEVIPLPRPRPPHLGEPQTFIAPIDRPRQVIQQ